jgi:hypothetical protein
MFPAIILAQPKITDIVWVGKNKEYLQILKKEAAVKKGEHVQDFKVAKYIKDSYLIFSSQHITGYIEQKYNIIRFTKDTLILAPEGRDIFKLCRPNEENQYVFVNCLNTFTFEKLHFESSFEHFTLTLDIDAEKNSRVKIHDDYMNDTKVVTTSIDKFQYKSLISILAAGDIDSFPEEYYLQNDEEIECCRSIFQIHYNNQLKRCTGNWLFPFEYQALAKFIWDYISSKAGQSSFGPEIWLFKEKDVYKTK